MFRLALTVLLVCAATAGGIKLAPEMQPRPDGARAEQRPAQVAFVPAGGNEILLERGRDGHFHVDVMVDGAPLRFLIDTGATEIILTPGDAARIGYHGARLDFEARFRTANGIVRAAPVRLREVRIGQFASYDVEAFVNEVDLGVSLLGMSFLERLKGYEMRGGRLRLYW